MKRDEVKAGQPGRVLVLAGTWSVCYVGVGLELVRVQAATRLGARKRAAKKIGVPVEQLAAAPIMPPVYRTVRAEPGSPAAG